MSRTTASRKTLVFEDLDAFGALCGPHDEHLKRLEGRLGIGVLIRGNQVTLNGPVPALQTADAVLHQLYKIARQGHPLTIGDVDRAVSILGSDPSQSLVDAASAPVQLAPGSRVVPRTPRQKEYLAEMGRNDLVFAIGPAGTGKTYLAMATAIQALLSRQVKHIVLTRPAVEAGERLGFLPGDLVEKVNPYLRPLYDALYDLLDTERGQKLIERGQIEIAPLAFMRGRTLSDAFIILDEAQNCTVEQMKMFLTRLGYHSKAVVTGDVTQTDLPPDRPSGLEHARRILDGVPGIGFCEFDDRDVMRHPLVQSIIRAYGAERSRAQSRPAEAPAPRGATDDGTPDPS
ncbi:MAG TPA: PhoH family protein [Myxococcota bacterium]|nr:PhoH family protein [Myxococcota bacterium]